MGLVVSSPSYMYQSPSGYIFRLRVPKDLRALVGKTEFRSSLRSGALREKLFGSEEYAKEKQRQSYGFWTPLIALTLEIQNSSEEPNRKKEICNARLFLKIKKEIQETLIIWNVPFRASFLEMVTHKLSRNKVKQLAAFSG